MGLAEDLALAGMREEGGCFPGGQLVHRSAPGPAPVGKHAASTLGSALAGHGAGAATWRLLRAWSPPSLSKGALQPCRPACISGWNSVQRCLHGVPRRHSRRPRASRPGKVENNKPWKEKKNARRVEEGATAESGAHTARSVHAAAGLCCVRWGPAHAAIAGGKPNWENPLVTQFRLHAASLPLETGTQRQTRRHCRRQRRIPRHALLPGFIAGGRACAPLGRPRELLPGAVLVSLSAERWWELQPPACRGRQGEPSQARLAWTQAPEKLARGVPRTGGIVMLPPASWCLACQHSGTSVQAVVCAPTGPCPAIVGAGARIHPCAAPLVSSWQELPSPTGLGLQSCRLPAPPVTGWRSWGCPEPAQPWGDPRHRSPGSQPHATRALLAESLAHQTTRAAGSGPSTSVPRPVSQPLEGK